MLDRAEKWDWDEAEARAAEVETAPYSAAIYFSLSHLPNDAKDIANIVELRRLLDKVGIKMDLYSTDDEKSYHFLRFNYEKEKTEEKISRRAGAKTKDLDGIGLDEVRAMLKNESAVVVAYRLGISRATLYRRIKKAEELEADGAKNPYV